LLLKRLVVSTTANVGLWNIVNCVVDDLWVKLRELCQRLDTSEWVRPDRVERQVLLLLLLGRVAHVSTAVLRNELWLVVRLLLGTD